jgi:hypothetical protein
LVVGLSTLLLIISASLIATQLYLSQPAMTEKIRAVFAKKFGGDLAFRDLRLNILTGLTVNDLRLNAETTPFLTIQRAELDYSPLMLFRKRIKVNRIELAGLRLDFAHRNNTWQIPRPNHNVITRPLTLSTGHNTFVILLDNLNFRDTAVTVRTGAADREGEIFRADGLNLTGRLIVQDHQRAASGVCSIRAMQFGSTLTLRDLTATLTYADDEFRFTKLSGRAYGGEVEGSITVPATREKENQHYGVYLHLSAVDAAALLRDFRATPAPLRARVDLYCDFWAGLNHPDLIQGKGYFTAKQAQLTGLKTLDLIATTLRHPALRDTNFDLTGSFKIADDQLTFYTLELISPDLKISASGTVNYDATLDLDALLTVNPALIERLPATAAEQFSTQPDGTKSISFKVSGPSAAPVCNLADKLYGVPRR